MPVIYGYVAHAPRDAHVQVYIENKGWELCSKDRECKVLAEAGYFEARNQSDLGVKAVMKTVLNRVGHRRWGDTITRVVYERCEFSYTCDGSKKRGIKETDQWKRMLSLAFEIYTGYTPIQLSSTHYHTKEVKPYWSEVFTQVAVIGDHIFYECKTRC